MKLSFVLFLISLLFLTCQTNPSSSPTTTFSPTDYQIAEPVHLQLVASEERLNAPVALDFGTDGSLWVLEMPGYMPNINGNGEEKPSGKILVLKDTDQDGLMDQHRVFLDGLVAPRALLLVYGGVLYAQPSGLYFAPIESDGRAGTALLIDSTYVSPGNIEHQANGLLMNLDNWIYSALCNKRYRRQEGKWLIENTAARGQWGLTKDHFGRLIYNNNANQLQGDQVLPMAASRNPFLAATHAIHQQINSDQNLYAIQATGVNRGYIDGVLDSLGRALKATSACGPLIYQGNQLPEAFIGNAFVCIPEINAIKRNRVTEQAGQLLSKQYYLNKEFLITKDTAFRPVNLYNGPDGSIYVVDMHKGIIQHRAYMSPYLRDFILKKGYEKITGMGRILKISGSQQPTRPNFDFSQMNAQQLVVNLSHPNVWIRDKSQQALIAQSLKSAIPLLKELLKNEEKTISRLHALWTLEGLDALDMTTLLTATESTHPEVVATALYLFDKISIKVELGTFTSLVNTLLNRQDPLIDQYLSASQTIAKLLPATDPLYHQVATRYPSQLLYAELMISAFSGQEEKLLAHLKNTSVPEWKKLIRTVIKKRDLQEIKTDFAEQPVFWDNRQKGLTLYRTYCKGCHGEDGNGITNLAPSLYDNQYVNGAPATLAAIILHGLSGPIVLNDQRYEFNAAMPGFKGNLSNAEIMSIIVFVQNSFSTKMKKISKERIEAIRTEGPANGGSWTAEDLEIKQYQ